MVAAEEKRLREQKKQREALEKQEENKAPAS